MTDVTKKTIGILQPGHAPQELARDKGDYDQCVRTLLGDAEFHYLSFDVEGGVFPESVAEADGWLITGSRHGAYEDHPWRDPLEDFVRAIHAAGLPLVGICFGHQIIARALGGTVERAGWIAGPQTYRGRDGHTFTVNAWHRDQVTRVPAQLEVFATGEGCPVAGLFEPGRVLTYQPHPEFDNAYMAGLFEARGDGLPEGLQVGMLDRVREARLDRPCIADHIRTFLKDPAFRL